MPKFSRKPATATATQNLGGVRKISRQNRRTSDNLSSNTELAIRFLLFFRNFDRSCYETEQKSPPNIYLPTQNDQP
ncbi:hypothetical protein [Leptospira santarosai]|uniref:hypothetical protein n=1 Tax=Leptospira santarosai TaxID=28183 RepID=UPI0024AFA053|nr:hypothetical protein [Leptospira santarosai]MDI7173321.1 hypothetical protein [Leptospira santarosai]MDI7193050.1 hypothetical protein [Leptospira santarosai]MDO6393145.1 hypothetical protein [Leptospira santarosai]MDO6397373.1 hypothetical protein [Leptospira santarosai]MDO6402890.1 hypothetical protein [Leptospira santarosai]